MKLLPDLRIGWIGFHREGLSAFEALLDQGTRIEAAITLADEPLAKRSMRGAHDDVAQRYNVPLHKVRHINDPESVALLKNLDLNVAFVIGWSQIVGRSAPHGENRHDRRRMPPCSPTTAAAPVNWAIIRGETGGGNTLIWLAENVDEGEIIDQTAFPITPTDTCATIYEKVARSNCDMILLAAEAHGWPTASSAAAAHRRALAAAPQAPGRCDRLVEEQP